MEHVPTIHKLCNNNMREKDLKRGKNEKEKKWKSERKKDKTGRKWNEINEGHHHHHHTNSNTSIFF